MRAGQAFITTIDPKSLALLRVRLRVWAMVMRAVDVPPICIDGQSLARELAGIRDELAAAGLFSPTSLEEWSHLARVVELDPDCMTAAEIHDQALAWIDRQKILIRLSLEVGGRPVPTAASTVDEIFFPASHYRALYGIPADRIRQAARRQQIRVRTVGNLRQYAFAGVRSRWPEDVEMT